MLARLKQWAGVLKRETIALYCAARDPRTPWLARIIAAAIVAYAFSPIDLIPDFIPVLGLLDDLLLLPAGLWLALRLIPDEVMADCRQKARDITTRPVSWTMAAVIFCIWCAAIAAALWMAASLAGVR